MAMEAVENARARRDVTRKQHGRNRRGKPELVTFRGTTRQLPFRGTADYTVRRPYARAQPAPPSKPAAISRYFHISCALVTTHRLVAMRACAQGCRSGRGLLGAAAPASASASGPAVEAQRAQLERALAATTTVLFVASLSYIALSTLYGCLCAGGRPRQEPGGGGGGGGSGALPPSAAAAAEETERALEEIPVVVVVVQARDDGGGEEAAAAAGECAVCLGEYAGGEEVRVLPACRHGFHRECVDRWLLTRAPTCPVCRAPVAAARPEVPDDKDRAAGDGATAGVAAV
ncbi:hypothetical protein ACP70R_044900 [Stipagrostis hirtigluma subsp. patula]